MAQNAGLPQLSPVFALALMDDTIFAGLYAKSLYVWSRNEPRRTKAGTVKPLALSAMGRGLSVGHNPDGIHWSEEPQSTEWTQASGDFESAAPVWAMASGGKLVVAGIAEDNGRTWSRTLQGLPAKSPGVSFLVQGNAIYAGVVITSNRRK